MSMDYLVEAVRHKVRNDALFANLCKSLQHFMADSGLSELDIVCAARIAAEENVRKQQEEYWNRELTRPFVTPIKPIPPDIVVMREGDTVAPKRPAPFIDPKALDAGWTPHQLPPLNSADK